MGEWATACPDSVVKRFNVLSVKSIIQSPSDDMLNVVLDIQHRKQTIIRDRAFLKLSILDIHDDDGVLFHRQQNLFSESSLLTHFTDPVDETDDSVREALKVGLQVNFTSADIISSSSTPLSPLNLSSYSVIIEIGIQDTVVDDSTSTTSSASISGSDAKVYDCVRISGNP